MKSQANLVFLTIGGDDLGFTGIVANCLLPYVSFFTHTQCSDLINSAEDLFQATKGNTKNVLKSIAAAMPKAQIVLVGYPRLVSPHCPGSSWNDVIGSDQNLYDTLEGGIPTVLNREMGTTRFHFISVAQAFVDHGPCAALSAQYIRGVGISPPWASYHPNIIGNSEIANLIHATGIQNRAG